MPVTPTTTIYLLRSLHTQLRRETCREREGEGENIISLFEKKLGDENVASLTMIEYSADIHTYIHIYCLRFDSLPLS